MSVIASYKFDSTVCADFTPEFNSEFTSDLYTITDVDNGDGTTTRTIESDSLPTLMRFGTIESASTGRERSLLQMLECNTDNITSMYSMFKNCTNLTFINLSNFNTQNVTNMNAMFYYCSKLTSLDVSNFNTSQVTNMGRMFSGCSKLTSLDVSNFNTSNVTNMSGMFYSCNLTSLDLSNFNTEKVTNMSNILANIPSLTNIGAVYCDSSTINKISNLVTTNTTIWYTDAKLEDLIVKDNITYKEYKSNILTVNEDVTLRSNGDICDELNLLTGQLTQRIGEDGVVLSQEVVKTVDLNSSNGDVKTPIVYKNGHILLQSDGLIPELRYSIPVSYSGLIAQNTMTNLKHSWRLDELEIMAYTSIVNSQYDSLILVATAETNEVVVSSDYVPDESLYNMLKVLVNANALENANEKINVFYLYGKLSDEMYIDLIMGDDM